MGGGDGSKIKQGGSDSFSEEMLFKGSSEK